MKLTKLLLIAALAWLVWFWWPAAIWEWAHIQDVYAGHPLKCDPKGGVPCNMKTCAHLAKKQAWCSPVCHNGCCKCPTEGPNECNGHAPERGQEPEEQSWLNPMVVCKRP